MQNRKDLLRAHRFLGRRVTAAIVNQQPDSPDLPMRRLTGTTIASVMVAAIICAVFGVIGFVQRGASTAWDDEGQIVVEAETGARLVYLDGRLHPVANYTSGRLIVGAGTLTRISAASMSGVPRGPLLGIVGAPEQLPVAEVLAEYPWSACTSTSEAGEGPTVTVVLGNDQQRALGSELPAASGVLVRADEAADGSLHLVAAGHRHAIEPGAARALGLETGDAVAVGTAWLNAVPAGNPLDGPEVVGIGEPGVLVGGDSTTVGQVFEAANVGTAQRYFVMLGDGLAPISQTEAALLLADPRAELAYPDGTPEPIPLSAADATAARRSATVISDPSLPAAPPIPVDPSDLADGVLCATFDADGASVAVSVGGAVPDGVAPEASGASDGSAATADHVVVAPGGGALMALATGDTGAGGSVFLVTDTGFRYPIADDQAATALGYAGVTPMRVPRNLLQLIPVGPVLSGSAARTPVEVSAAAR